MSEKFSSGTIYNRKQTCKENKDNILRVKTIYMYMSAW